MTSLTLVRRIAARPSIVFEALTTPDGIACWWGPDDGPVLLAEADVRVGGCFRVRFRMLDGSEHETVRLRSWMIGRLHQQSTTSRGVSKLRAAVHAKAAWSGMRTLVT
jgi:Activator of Hsp90 ATPase homolog 1-like protein